MYIVALNMINLYDLNWKETMFTIWREFEIGIIVNSKVKSRSIYYLLEPLQLPIPPEIVVVRDSGQIAGNLEPHAVLLLMVRTSTCAKVCFVLFSRNLVARHSGCHSAIFFGKLSVSSILFGGTFWLPNKIRHQFNACTGQTIMCIILNRFSFVQADM